MTTRQIKLFSVSADAKTVKGEKQRVLTGVMYLAPHALSGYQVCPKATAGCMLACLYTAGRGVFSNTQLARINKTKFFFERRDVFMATLVKNIASIVVKARKLDMIPAIRLNGTSDIGWEKIAVVKDGVTYRNLMLAFPHVQFYDYTKILGRKAALSLPNYHLTYSLAEDNDADALEALAQGYNVAAVLRLGRTEPKPATFGGYPVVNGDDDDVRFRDPKGGHVIGLFPKGRGRYDTSGFVREPNAGFKSNPVRIIPVQLAA